jgi:LysM repeat protein
MVDRSSARILAPLALVAAAIGIVVVVGTSGSSSTAPGSPTPVSDTIAHRHAHRAKLRPHSYVVRPGDTLTAIATRTGVTIDTIQQLNPSVDPQTLRTGERLKLTP